MELPNEETKKHGPNERTDQHSRKRDKMEISNLPDAKFKMLVMRMLKNLVKTLTA